MSPLLLALTLCAAPAAPDLYQGARVGMTVAQVKHVFPDLIAPPPGGEHKGYDTLIVSRTVNQSSPATVNFMFKAGRLSFVVVDLDESAATGPHVASTDFAALKLALTDRYGKSAECDDDSDATLGHAACKWAARGVAITLETFAVGGVISLNVEYEASPTAKSSGL